MYYIIQENLFKERHFNTLIDYLKRYGLEYEIIPYRPFTEELIFKTDRKDVYEVTDWPNQEQLCDLIQSGDEEESIFSAFTVGELGVMLPDNCESRKCYLLFIAEEEITADRFSIYVDTEAKARAALLIHLLERQIITPEQVNQRLNS